MIRDYIQRTGTQPYFSVLLRYYKYFKYPSTKTIYLVLCLSFCCSRFKELNPALKDLHIPPYKVTENIFYPTNRLLVRLRENLKSRASPSDVPSIIAPYANEVRPFLWATWKSKVNL